MKSQVNVVQMLMISVTMTEEEAEAIVRAIDASAESLSGNSLVVLEDLANLLKQTVKRS